MPPLQDIAEFLGCQAFGRTTLPTGVDFRGKTIIVTGANAGLGLEACKHLARMHASCIVLACRSVERGQAACEEIYKSTATSRDRGPDLRVWEVDLTRQASVDAFVQRARNSEELKRVDAVIANAGVEFEEFRVAEGLEETLKVNVLSTMSLCQGLLPVLAETARICGTVTHLTLVGSLIHFFGAHRELHAVPEGRDVLDVLSDRNAANMKARYPLSKLMEHLCFREFVAANAAADVVINIVNPGWCGTQLFRNKHQPLGERLCFAVLGRTAEEGSRTLVHGICAGRQTHGKYLSECQVKRQSSYMDSDAGLSMGRRVWKELQARLGS